MASSTRSIRKLHAMESPEAIQERIRQRAYELYELRGKEDGYDVDDWLKAELEVKLKAKAAAV